ncbi:MAG: HAD family hydrolase [Verrucomicrobiota bacterium]
MKPRLLLFDIDGTILDCGGAGFGALKAGLIATFDLHDRAHEMPELQLAGATDAAITRQLFAAFEIEDTPEHRERFFSAYIDELGQGFAANGREARLLPGAQQLLEQSANEENVHLGLLTGNIERGARIKLGHFDLDHHFEFGAFGDDAEHRNLLGPIALERAQLHANVSFEPHHAIVIGDTPRDIDCARAAGMKVVAVATGHYSREQLAEHEPDALVESLEGYEFNELFD